MKNLNELKNKYFDFMKRANVIEEALENNLNKYKEYPKSKGFHIFEDEMYKEWFLENLDFLKEEEPEYENFNLERLEEEYRKYKIILDYAVEERVGLYEEYMKLNIEFDKWTTENNLTYHEIDEWEKEVEVYKSKWHGWDSNDLIYDSMIKSIKMTKESEINKLVKDARKVLKIVDEESLSWIHEFIDSIEYVNTRIRRELNDDGVTMIFILDVMENHGIWNVYKEGFMMSVLKVMQYVDAEFLDFAQDCYM